jgi:adenosine deaminase
MCTREEVKQVVEEAIKQHLVKTANINDQFAELVTDAIRAALADPAIHCRYNITPDKHTKQHEALQRFINFTDRIESIKWKSLQSLVIFIVLGLFSLAIFGAAVKIKLLSFLGLAH